MIYVSSAHDKYISFVKEIRKHPYKLYEYYIGKKIPLWQKIYLDVIGKIKKSDYERLQKAINKATKPYRRREDKNYELVTFKLVEVENNNQSK